MAPVIRVENLTKIYNLGQIGTGTLSNDLKVLWAKVRRKPNPLLKIGQEELENHLLRALNNVTFDVEQGEVVGIIGHNGAGKSTILKILSRVTSPTSGKIKVKGRIASLLEVGTGFHPELTGRENIYLNGSILGMSKKEVNQKFDEIVSFAEVEKFIDTPVKRYSSGMYVRLAFAVAAHLEPEILIVDEVLAVGDASFQEKCLGKMEDVSRGGRTVLFVSHNMAAIKHICSRALLFNTGELVFDQVPALVIDRYMGQQTEDLPLRDVENIPRKAGTQEVKIKSIGILAENNSYKTNMCVWEPFNLEFTIFSNTGGQELTASVWFLIYSSDGTVVLSSFQMDSIAPVRVTSLGKKLKVQVNPNYLSPGKYTISAGVFGKQKEFFDWIEKAISFEIVANFVNGEPYDHRLGILASNYPWFEG